MQKQGSGSFSSDIQIGRVSEKTTKRGFNTKRDAEEWVRNFLMSQQADFNMNFEEFVKIYRNDINNRNRSSTTETKDNIIDTKILPYFAKEKHEQHNSG